MWEQREFFHSLIVTAWVVIVLKTLATNNSPFYGRIHSGIIKLQVLVTLRFSEICTNYVINSSSIEPPLAEQCKL